jgi:GT2 family glycosyltransferase
MNADESGSSANTQDLLQGKTASPEARSPDMPWGLVYAVVVTFDGKHLLDRCIGSLLETDYPHFRILLVDNGSSDGSSDHIAATRPEVAILRISSNVGFARAANRGMREALERGARHVAIFNDDTAAADNRWLREAILRVEADPRIGVIGFREVSLMDEAVPPAEIELTDVPQISGGGLLLRGSMLRRIGLFDEVYFMLAEEDDLEARALSAGYRIKKLNIPVCHAGRATTSKFPRQMTYLQMRNYLRIGIKHMSVMQVGMRIIRMVDVACNPISHYYDAANLVHRRIRGTGNLLLNGGLLCRAIGWNLLFLPDTIRIRLAERRRIQNARHLLEQEAVR